MNKQLTKSEFEQLVLKNPKLVLVKFRNNWNGACQIMAPIYKELSEQYASDSIFYWVDTDDDPELYLEFGILELPTILLFKDGQVIDFVIGTTSREIIREKIMQAISDSN